MSTYFVLSAASSFCNCPVCKIKNAINHKEDCCLNFPLVCRTSAGCPSISVLGSPLSKGQCHRFPRVRLSDYNFGFIVHCSYQPISSLGTKCGSLFPRNSIILTEFWEIQFDSNSSQCDFLHIWATIKLFKDGGLPSQVMVKVSLVSGDTNFNLYKSSLIMQIPNLNLKDSKSELGGVGHSGISPSDSNIHPLWPASHFLSHFNITATMDSWISDFPRMLMAIDIFQSSFPIANCYLSPFEVTTV